MLSSASGLRSVWPSPLLTFLGLEHSSMRDRRVVPQLFRKPQQTPHVYKQHHQPSIVLAAPRLSNRPRCVGPPLPLTPTAPRRWGLVRRLEHCGGSLPSPGLPRALLLGEDGREAGDAGLWPGQKGCRWAMLHGSQRGHPGGEVRSMDTSGDRENLENDVECALDSGRGRPNLSAASEA